MTYNEKSKKAIMKWRETHGDEYLEYMRPHSLRYYKEHKDVCNARRVKLYYYQKECKIFRNILVDEL